MRMDAVACDTRSPARFPGSASHGTMKSSWILDPGEDLILSEVHIGKAPSNATACTTHFRFSCPRLQTSHLNARAKSSQKCSLSSQLKGQSQHMASSDCLPLDADGDVIVKRRRSNSVDCESVEKTYRHLAGSDSSCASCGQCHDIIIHHTMATSLQHVGKQVWRGAALLADLMLSQPQLVHGYCVVELGAGTGLAGIAAGCAASDVLLTDLSAMLPLCQANVCANLSLFSQYKSAAEPATEGRSTSGVQPWVESSSGGARLDVLPLDWMDLPPLAGCPCLRAATQGVASSPAEIKAAAWANAHDWSMLQLCRLQHAQVVLAADCIYDDDLTTALMAAAAELLMPCMCSPGVTKLMYVALEKRWNFTLRDMDSRAAAYDFWRTLFREGNRDHAAQQLKERALSAGPKSLLTGVQLDGSAFHSVLDHDSGSDLEIWRLALGCEV